jgi:osmotically-inducible protein OsmY
MKIVLAAVLALPIPGLLFAEETSSFRAYVDSDICARLMLGPVTPTRVECSQRTAKEGAHSVLVRLSNNMVLTPNDEKPIRPLVGQVVQVSGELKASNGTVKMASAEPINATSVPPGDPDRRLLDPHIYKNDQSAQLYQQIRFQLARLPYVTDYDYISFTVTGREVVLTGWTIRDVNRSSAVNLVENLPGVGSVINNIEWIPLSNDDNNIRYQARVQLRQKLPNYFSNGASDIRIIVKNATVVLVGVVANRADFDTAYRECNQLPWVGKVFNMLQIRPATFGQ